MQHDTVIEFTRERFPGMDGEQFDVSVIEKGGSGRKYYRIRAESASMILVKYSPERVENVRFVEIARFLDGAGVQVPKIFLHDPDEGLIWMQDLGDRDLWSFRDEVWPARREKYYAALRTIFRMHHDGTRAFRYSGLTTELEFDQQLYLWEQGYFVENCLGGVFGMDAEQAARYSGLPAFQRMAADLAGEPRVLVHRDFQSQNVLWCEGEALLIDFQGMRPGLAGYDLASLLYDPYVELAREEREELLAYYKRVASENGAAVADQFDAVFDRCAVQRLMQALGAYGFLGLRQGKGEFLRHVPAAKRLLREVAARIDGLDDFVTLLESLP
jgi:aminoglycoside/choline kinase family phosphotransferase